MKYAAVAVEAIGLLLLDHFTVHDPSEGMNGSRQMELHYINTGFPYTITESFMDFFEGLTYAHADFAIADAFHDQANPYWAMMHTNSYKYGYSGAGNYYSYGHVYDMNDYMHRADGGRRIWDNTTPVNNTESPNVVLQGGETPPASASSTTEECIQQQVHQNSSSPQVIWQDNIDPDNMTYEELLDLGEAVGTQSRGLSQEHISLLPVTKYKCGFFSRRKTRRERCVICQMEYRRGNLQMTLPCKHVYHASCVTRWLSINKVCPVCFAEVPGDEPKRQ
ncbi:E3 ubiquitin-protein ligase BIG BROTHER isoform X1 [Oryza brachyantha]|uniref:RING-type domain-containing protein n=3 Tax=Oryza brachyantha TaxID=4533 RepID=J3LKI1_ORYBR|nr:E3 ubiquitin-protein ligase BIG BROTHER isoform X1 [Oryza brachyantha]